MFLQLLIQWLAPLLPNKQPGSGSVNYLTPAMRNLVNVALITTCKPYGP